MSEEERAAVERRGPTACEVCGKLPCECEADGILIRSGPSDKLIVYDPSGQHVVGQLDLNKRPVEKPKP